jgi:peptidoglycan hydrolase-like protein with peptidoglycan-binding domain
MKSKLGFLAIFAILQGTVFAAPTYSMGTISVPVKNTVTATTTNPAAAMPVVVVATSSATTSCASYINTFHKLGDNGAEVVTLQKFLNKYNGAKLNEKGFYGPVTMQEVQNFQYTYGIKTTGWQHQKTTAAINNIVCGKLAVKDRKVYIAGGANTTVAQVTPTVAKTVAKVDTKNIYPNPKTSPKTETQAIKSTASSTSTIAATTSTPTGVYANFKSDFEKVKENYKAYLLVFLLVLALFWFLRKAATE